MNAAIGESGAVASSSSSAAAPVSSMCARTRCVTTSSGALDVEAQGVAVEGQRLVEALHRDADVIQHRPHSEPPGAVTAARATSACAAA